jgi:hypothetical protein
MGGRRSAYVQIRRISERNTELVTETIEKEKLNTHLERPCPFSGLL